MKFVYTGAFIMAIISASLSNSEEGKEREYIRIRGIYAGVPRELMKSGKKLTDYGINAIFLGASSLNSENIDLSCPIWTR